MNTDTATTAHRTITIGTGQAVHVAYFVNGRLCGSLCDTAVYCKGKRMRETDLAPTCSRCAKATDRLDGALPRD